MRRLLAPIQAYRAYVEKRLWLQWVMGGVQWVALSLAVNPRIPTFYLLLNGTHECGHAVACLIARRKTRSLRINGVHIGVMSGRVTWRYDTSDPPSATTHFFIMCAGIYVNLAEAAMFLAGFWLWHMPGLLWQRVWQLFWHCTNWARTRLPLTAARSIGCYTIRQHITVITDRLRRRSQCPVSVG